MPKTKDKSIQYRILMSLVEGDKRFSELLSDIKRATLSNELQELERYRLIERKVDKKIRPPRVTYSITSKGRETLAERATSVIEEMKGLVSLLQYVMSPQGSNVPRRSQERDPFAQATVNGILAMNIEKQSQPS